MAMRDSRFWSFLVGRLAASAATSLVYTTTEKLAVSSVISHGVTSTGTPIRTTAQTRRPELSSVLLLPIAGLAAAVALLPIVSSDVIKYFIPWMDAVQRGGLASISSEFADYTPPYIYLMYIASWLLPLVSPLAAIKLINLPFIATSSLAIYKIVLLSSGAKAAPLRPLRSSASRPRHS
jgi:hypothetical protein